MIIDPTYFFGILSVGANLYTENADTTTAANIGGLAQAIDVYENEYLRLLLGENVSDFLLFVESEQAERDWGGLLSILKGSRTQLSPIACYVYFNYLHDLAEQATEIGVTTPSGSDARSPKHKQVKAWNYMTDIHRGAVLDWFDANGIEWNAAELLRKLSSLGV